VGVEISNPIAAVVNAVERLELVWHVLESRLGLGGLLNFGWLIDQLRLLSYNASNRHVSGRYSQPPKSR